MNPVGGGIGLLLAERRNLTQYINMSFCFNQTTGSTSSSIQLLNVLQSRWETCSDELCLPIFFEFILGRFVAKEKLEIVKVQEFGQAGFFPRPDGRNMFELI